mmetsp:Transcript_58752/g.158264  ORF Transcript_58752/g.158264 Transcript_58752/m.158264 type:complete len:527 (+) Transcript_58752:88-1668(+)
MVFSELQGMKITLAPGRPPSASSLRLGRPPSVASTGVSAGAAAELPPRPISRSSSRQRRTSVAEQVGVPLSRNRRNTSRDALAEHSTTESCVVASAPTAAQEQQADSWVTRERLGSRPISAVSAEGPMRLRHLRPPPAPGSARSAYGGTGRAPSSDDKPGSAAASTVASARDLHAPAPTPPAATQPFALLPLALPSGGSAAVASDAQPPSSALARAWGAKGRGEEPVDTLGILNSARSACSGPCEPEDQEPTSPCSPLTALVRRQLADQQQRAVVRHVELRQARLGRDSRREAEDDADGLGSSGPPSRVWSHTSSRGGAGEESLLETPASSARGAASSIQDVISSFPPPVRPSAPYTASVRELSREEVKERSRSAAAFFREAHAINRQARPQADHAAIVEEARRSREQERERLATERAEEEFRRLRDHRLAREAEVAAARARERSRDALASAPALAAAVAAQRPKLAPQKSLMEKFGYGVKPKDEPTELAPSLVYVPQPKVNNRIGIKAGNNDLKERLARKRRTVE